jgi:hypothetical protein
MSTLEGYQYMQKGEIIVHDQLTAPGSADVIKMNGCGGIIYQYKIAGIDTSVVLRIEGSFDNSNWFNLDADETDTTQTANGTYAFVLNHPVPFIRFTFVSEAGGTAATIDVKVYLWRLPR